MNRTAADHTMCETQRVHIRCTTADRTMIEIQRLRVGRHSFAVDHLSPETQLADIRCRRQAKYHVKSMADLPAAILLSMGHRASEIQRIIAHRSRRRIMTPMKPEPHVSAADLSPHRTTPTVKPREPVSGAAICFAGVI